MKNKSTKNLTQSRNRGSKETTSKVPNRDGDVMTIAAKEVISIPPTTSIKEAAKVMMEHHFRRLPITDPGSGKLLGIVTVMDILDFFGGGDKYKIIEKKYSDNFLQAINEPIKEIMTRDVITVSNKDSIDKTIDAMLENDVGAVPIIDADKKIVGIITERDISLTFAGVFTEEIAEDFMTTDVISITPGTPLESVCKIMVRNCLRRLPVVGAEEYDDSFKKILGIVTTTNIVRYINDVKMFSSMSSNAASEVLENKIFELMTKEVITAEPTTRIGELCDIFKEYNIGGVPIVKNNEIIGIITERDVLRAFK